MGLRSSTSVRPACWHVVQIESTHASAYARTVLCWDWHHGITNGRASRAKVCSEKVKKGCQETNHNNEAGRTAPR